MTTKTTPCPACSRTRGHALSCTTYREEQRRAIDDALSDQIVFVAGFASIPIEHAARIAVSNPLLFAAGVRAAVHEQQGWPSPVVEE